MSSLVVPVFLALLRIARLGRSTRQAILILPPASAGSLGDEAMCTVAIQVLRNRGGEIGLIAYDSVDREKYEASVDEIIDLSNYFKAHSLCDVVKFLFAAAHYERLYFLGADLMDGYYGDLDMRQRVNLVSLAGRLGLETAVLSFSFNSRPTEASIQLLRNLPRNIKFFVRDPISYVRVTSCIKRSVDLVADLAFLLPAHVSAPVVDMLKWIREEQSHGRIVIGVNVNPLLASFSGQCTPKEFVKVYIETLQNFIVQGKPYSFLLIPHDSRGKESDVILGHVIMDSLPDDVAVFCNAVPMPCSAAEIKAIVAALDFVVSGRMHLAVACLGQGVPVVCIGYQDKFEGLFRHFELDEMVIDSKRAMEPGCFQSFVTNGIEHRIELRERINARLSYVQKLAQDNFKHIR